MQSIWQGLAALRPQKKKRWVRYREDKSRVQRPWEEMVAEFTTRFKAIAQDINDNLDVDGLCRGLPKRVQLLVDAEGDRIKK